MKEVFYDNKRIIYIPEIRTDFEGYSYLSKLDEKIKNYSDLDESISINLENMTWIDVNMCSVLGAIIQKHKSNGAKIEVVKVNRNVENILSKNGFLTKFMSGFNIKDSYGTVVPYRRYNLSDESKFPDYVSKISKDRERLKFNQNTRSSLLNSILELFSNSVIHSGSGLGIFVCGQYYPNKHTIRFTITDLGVGIRDRVSRFLLKDISDQDSILWAITKRNSTKYNIPGGLGLSFLIEFVTANEGQVILCSGNAYVKISESNREILNMNSRFLGTSISLIINTDRDSVYLPVQEISEEDLF
ncbi:ATP-binding protein [Deinococcus gobiensis]|uniref:ATPase, histidine kinase-, DNA gyrase B-, and HSP90-like domain protein n=1 Tax=Deinococcus gobiensis (strain DSM 21396 / JCM 16679 / CGMCC 1.7299 / I-0) TaxID=745776 RepID=H8H3V3_DEIGI|nr:ATP-binding protein [Deinococcus gobiensis]AFD28200.1 ATPase, histidine kinase-, DNA gyrase B-, and HSP90-like domain protein [Deinococcus gobiensis I-0]